VFHAQRHRQRGRSFDCHLGAEYAAGGHIDRNAEPQSTDRPPLARIHEDDIRERVAHLYEFECLSGFEGAGSGLRDGRMYNLLKTRMGIPSFANPDPSSFSSGALTSQ
jgi:hypothetical protein